MELYHNIPKAIFARARKEANVRRSIRRLKGIALQTLLAMTVLTAVKGVNNFCGHTEKYYNLSMRKVVKRAQDMGIPCEYWVREDGVKMFGPWVICAAHPSVTRYTRIDTNLGPGIVLDYNTVYTDKTLIDIVTAW